MKEEKPRVKLTKIEGEELSQEGLFVDEPKIGESFEVYPFLATSRVVEILDDNTFKTENSTYKWEKYETEE
jgi:hypothetical protein